MRKTEELTRELQQISQLSSTHTHTKETGKLKQLIESSRHHVDETCKITGTQEEKVFESIDNIELGVEFISNEELSFEEEVKIAGGCRDVAQLLIRFVERVSSPHHVTESEWEALTSLFKCVGELQEKISRAAGPRTIVDPRGEFTAGEG